MSTKASPHHAQTAIAGVLAGVVLATVVSAGIVAERLWPGRAPIMLAANLVVMVVAAGILIASPPFSFRFSAPEHAPGSQLARRRATRAVLFQALGAVIAVGVVHAALRSQLAAYPWLREQSPQLVNDGMAVFGALALIWASADPPQGTIATIAALALILAYVTTSAWWHLDAAAPGGATSAVHWIQAGVAGQFACVAVFTAGLRRILSGAR